MFDENDYEKSKNYFEQRKRLIFEIFYSLRKIASSEAIFDWKIAVESTLKIENRSILISFREMRWPDRNFKEISV